MVLGLEGIPACMNDRTAIVWAAGPRKSPSPGRKEALRGSRDRPPRLTFPQLRDPVLFVAGLLGVAHETLIAPEPRWSLLVIFGAMMALPIPLRADEARRNGGNG